MFGESSGSIRAALFAQLMPERVDRLVRSLTAYCFDLARDAHGRSKRAYYHTRKVGGKRGDMIPIGSLDDGLIVLRNRCIDCAGLIAAGKHPKKHLKEEQKKKQIAAQLTFDKALDVFVAFAIKTDLWNPKTQDYNLRVIRKHIKTKTAFINMPSRFPKAFNELDPNREGSQLDADSQSGGGMCNSEPVKRPLPRGWKLAFPRGGGLRDQTH
jgi:hypothetical protein